MYPKFDGMKTYRCNNCSVIFGVDRDLHKNYCPSCKGNSTLIGEGMMMFFPIVSKEPEVMPSTNLDIGNYPPVLTADHIAEIVSVSTRVAYELMERKDFPLIRIGRLKRVNRDEFFKWLKSSH